MIVVNDISFWQNVADFSKMASLSKGVILRAGQGTREDIKFQQFRADAKAAGFPYGNYLYYDNRVHPKRQAEAWAATIGDDEGALGSWLDIEQDLAGAYKSYKDWYDCTSYFLQLKPKARLGIYTRASYFNDPAFSIPVNHALRHYPLWVAHYNQFVDYPDLPKGWIDWELWQFSDHGDGYAHGVGSREIDMNRFNGTEAEFLARYGVGESPINKSTILADFGGKIVEYRKVE